MTKKTFKTGLDALIGEKKKGPGRPKTSTRQTTKSSQEGTKPGMTRATFILHEDKLEKLKAIAYWDRVRIMDVVGTAIDEYLTRYEEEKGEVKPKTL